MSGASRRNSSRGPFKSLYPPFWDQYIHQLVMAQSFDHVSAVLSHCIQESASAEREDKLNPKKWPWTDVATPHRLRVRLRNSSEARCTGPAAHTLCTATYQLKARWDFRNWGWMWKHVKTCENMWKLCIWKHFSGAIWCQVTWLNVCPKRCCRSSARRSRRSRLNFFLGGMARWAADSTHSESLCLVNICEYNVYDVYVRVSLCSLWIFMGL